MVERRLDEAATAMGGELIGGDPAARWRGAALDSRLVQGGELFFALAGERTDGHRFVGEALARGAAAAVVERVVEEAAGPLIRVSDATAALHALTRAVREQVPRRLVAITGSSGKTTTKELLAAMLATSFKVARSPGNLNNLLGFPLALLGIDDDVEWMVAEMGMSEPGELREIARLGRPDVAVYTNVRPVHLEFFDSLGAIAEAKAELLEEIGDAGLVIVNADDPEVMRIAGRFGGRVVRYALSAAAEYGAEGLEPIAPGEPGTRFELVARGERVPVRLSLHGRYNVENFLAAAACACELGVSASRVAAAVAAIEPAAMRGVVHYLPRGGCLVDDSYNSNPDALSQALESARTLPGRRRWAVLGAMLELGPDSARFHREAGRRAAELGFSPILGVGEAARELVAGAAEAGGRAEWLADAAAAAARAAEELRTGDVVLVKGSRGVGLEAVARALQAREGGA